MNSEPRYMISSLDNLGALVKEDKEHVQTIDLKLIKIVMAIHKMSAKPIDFILFMKRT